MLLIVYQCFLMTLSRKIIVFKPTLQTTNKFFFFFPFKICPKQMFACGKMIQSNASEEADIFPEYITNDINAWLFMVRVATLLT